MRQNGIFLVLVLLIAGLQYLLSVAAPHYRPLTIELPEKQRELTEFPAVFQEERRVAKVHFALQSGALRHSLFSIHTDDCITGLVVNEKQVPFTRPLCTYPLADTFDLSAYLQTGENRITAYVRNHSNLGMFDISVARSDPLYLFCTLLTYLCLALIFQQLLQTHPSWADFHPLYYCFLLGVLLRLMYVTVTPPTVRAHDPEAHRYYVQHIAEHGELPKYDQEWETHQAPLYYLALAPAEKLLKAFQIEDAAINRFYQWISCAMGVLALALALQMGRILFPRNQQAMWLYGGLVSTFPGFIYPSARIGNDILLLLIATGFIAALQPWWHRPHRQLWLGASALLGLGLLTKLNAVFLFPVVFFCAVLHRTLLPRERVQNIFYALLLPIFISSWFFYSRFIVEQQPSVIGDTQNLTADLLLETTPKHFLVFNPLQVLQQPYVHTFLDETRRSYYWETLFRTAHFGEWNFEDYQFGISELLLFFAMQVLALAVLGIWRDLNSVAPSQTPLHLLLLFSLLGHAIGRILYPYGPVSDFRYIAYLVIPIAYFATRGVMSIRTARKEIAHFLCLQTIFGYGLFFTLLYLSSTPIYGK